LGDLSYPFILQRIQLPDPCRNVQIRRPQGSEQDRGHGM